MDKPTTVYRLLSAPMLHAPGVVAYLIRTYRTDPRFAVEVLAAGFGELPARVALGLLDGSIPYRVDGFGRGGGAMRTHKASGWTREPLRDGSMCYRVTPVDGCDVRIVRFLSAGSWANDPADDRARIGEDRIVVVEGPALPPWAVEWLELANRKQCERAREAFEAALDDADFHSASRDGW